jgi:hypothetical protein
MRTAACIVLVIAAFATGVWTGRRRSEPAGTSAVPDTVIIRDTLCVPVPEPHVVTVVRRDTIRDSIPYITPEGEAVVPIVRKTYVTEDYKATIEGYRPELVSLELYPKTVTITKSPKWALTAGAGVGYGRNGVQPYIGLSLGFVLWKK